MLLKIFYNSNFSFLIILSLIIIICNFINVFSYIISLIFLFLAIIDLVYSKKHRIQSYIFWCILLSTLEIISRITGAQVAYEYGKYAIIILSLILIVLNSINSSNYLIFLLLIFLLPGIFIGKSVEEITVYKNFAFYMSGQFCFIFALVCLYRAKVTYDFFYLILKLIFICCFLISFFLYLKSPDLSEISFTTEANFEASGGFGPNQISTVLGFGIFCGVVLFLNGKYLFKNKIFDVLLLLFLTFRLLLTFSRGGATAAVISIIFYLILFLFFRYRTETKQLKRIFINILLVTIILTFIWNLVNSLTDGVLAKRYVETVIDDDEQKFSIKDDRINVAGTELESFKNNIFFGLGVGGSQKYRLEEYGVKILSHNEVTRLLGDHGLLGLLFLLLLIILIIFNIYKSDISISINNISIFCLALLTYSHSSTRLSITCFLLALSYILIIKTKD